MLKQNDIINYLKAKIMEISSIEIGSQYTKGKIDILIEILKVIENDKKIKNIHRKTS